MSSASIASDVWHALKQQLLWSSFPAIFWYRLAQFWGTYQGYRRALDWNWDLRQTFYYPHGLQSLDKPATRKVQRIQYKE